MDNFIITAAGRKVELQPVAIRFVEKQKALVKKRFEEAGEPINPPWYYSVEPDEKGEGGEKIFWDAASVAKDGNEEEKKAWAKHQDALNRLKIAEDTREQEVMLLRGIKNEEDKTPTPEWVKEQEQWGVELPTDPQQLALEFIQDQILETVGDMSQTLIKLMAINLKGIKRDEEIEAFEATFQDVLAGELEARINVGKNLNGTSPVNGASEAKQARGVELQPEKERLESSPVLGDNSAI